jgi:glucokinase
MSHVIGVDLGGTHLRAALVDLQTGRLSGTQRVKSLAHEGYAAVVARIVALTQAILAESDTQNDPIAGLGIGIPGSIDLEYGRTLLLPNLPGDWRDAPLQADLQSALGLPVRLINDVRAITLGEFTFGAGRGVESMACYAVGTGIGGGVVVNGRLHLGISASAGELGHQVVEPDGLPCNCGGRGCLEMYASGPAIAGRAVKAIIQRRPTLLSELCGGDLNRIDVELVVQAARAGDELAREVFAEAGRYIGFGVVNTLVTISPRKVIIAGGVSAAGDLLLEPIRRVVRERVHLVPVEQVEILPAELGDDAGILGAALWSCL